MFQNVEQNVIGPKFELGWVRKVQIFKVVGFKIDRKSVILL